MKNATFQKVGGIEEGKNMKMHAEIHFCQHHQKGPLNGGPDNNPLMDGTNYNLSHRIAPVVTGGIQIHNPDIIRYTVDAGMDMDIPFRTV
jgi:hypothetical protein